MTPPSRLENLDETGEAQRDGEEYRCRCRPIHYHYVTSAREGVQYAPLRRLYGSPVRALYTFDLKVALGQAEQVGGAYGRRRGVPPRVRRQGLG